MKDMILKLRREGKTYSEITKICGCVKSTVAYHCKLAGMDNPSSNRRILTQEQIDCINEYYKTHTVRQTAEQFSISSHLVKSYVGIKRVPLTNEARKSKNYNRVKSRRQENKRRAVEYKGGKCELCGYDRCIWALTFHHTDSLEKDFTIASYSTLSWNKIKEEIDKCMLVCANCHAEIHYNQYLSNLH